MIDGIEIKDIRQDDQRKNIAWASISKAPILILDEAMGGIITFIRG